MTQAGYYILNVWPCLTYIIEREKSVYDNRRARPKNGQALPYDYIL